MMGEEIMTRPGFEPGAVCPPPFKSWSGESGGWCLPLCLTLATHTGKTYIYVLFVAVHVLGGIVVPYEL